MKLFELFETEDDDQINRMTARETANNISVWLDKNADNIKSKLQLTRYGYKISAKAMGLPYKNLFLIFSKGNNAASFGTFTNNPNNKFIMLKLLLDLSEITNIDVLFKKYGRSLFIHEFIHYLDDKRVDYKNSGVDQHFDFNNEKDWQKYISSPEEFNAYYQQATAKLEDRLDEFEDKIHTGDYDRLKTFLQKMTVSEFVEWFKSENSDMFHSGVIKHFDEKYTKKLNKRLARFFAENILTRFESIDEAARIGTGVRKDEIPEKYKKYPLINRGTTSAILELDADTVLMLTKDGIKKDWLVNELGIADMIDDYDTNHPKLGRMTTYVLKMPKLYPLSKENRKMARDLEELLRSMNRKAHQMNVDAKIGINKLSHKQVMTRYKQNIINAFFEYFDEYDQTNQQEHVLSQLIRFLSNYDVDQYEWDLRQGNFMQTKTGELVILDPIVDKEIVDIFGRGRK